MFWSVVETILQRFNQNFKSVLFLDENLKLSKRVLVLVKDSKKSSKQISIVSSFSHSVKLPEFAQSMSL